MTHASDHRDLQAPTDQSGQVAAANSCGDVRRTARI